MNLFAWLPSYTPKMTRKPRVLESQFGDGYAQRVADGINNVNVAWTLNFDARTEDEAAALIAFLDAMGGWQPFVWIDPNGLLAMWVCQDYGSNRTSPQLYQVTATLTRVFTPLPGASTEATASQLLISG